jgi:Tfp pilus assembly protein PilF
MIRTALRLSLCFVLLLGAGCANGPFQDLPYPTAKGGASALLEEGIRDYDDGNYRQASRKIKAALDEGLSSKQDRVTAHKYLAFISCVSNREIQCREEFRQAFEIDPRFDLTAAEAGHPIWGPVFRSVKDHST